MAVEKMLTLDDFLGTNDRTYPWTIPSRKRAITLRRLTHGEVKELRANWVTADGTITQETQDKIVAMGMAEPTVTIEQLNDYSGDRTALVETYLQIASECGLIRLADAPKPEAGEANAEAGESADPLAGTTPTA